MLARRAVPTLALVSLAAAAACRPFADTVAWQSGGDSCTFGDPPAGVAAWVNESWAGALSGNVASRQDWLLDAIVEGQGVVNVCVRWGATTTFTTAARDQIERSMRTWLQGWLQYLEVDACFPYPQGVTVKLAGIAVKPGQESLLEWTDRTISVYTETDPASDPAGEPRCPDACSFYLHQDHEFPDCPGGAEAHFDYAIWLDDALPGNAVAVGSGWGLRMPARAFTAALGAASDRRIQQVMGYGFGFQSYASWTGSAPAGGALMFGDGGAPPKAADGWLLRRLWQEQKVLRGW
jgi:hypothetical protein